MGRDCRLAGFAEPLGFLPTRSELVGRAHELGFLRAQYDAVASGEGGRLVFITGEGGVGKS
ncbi:MAG: ATP-binding protein, partial [Chloroflexi bacterium]|nr:ATP-binding protein [Chloroflexota bacterium]